MSTTLYKKDAKGALRFWTIDDDIDTLIMEYGQVGGETQEQTEYIEPNSFRNVNEQIISRMNSRINSKIDQGYYKTKEQAIANSGENTLGYKKPMLATPFGKLKDDIDYKGSIYQYKYDGHRCLITNDCGDIKAYTRGGKPIKTISHILKGIEIPEGTTLDGELYAHGHKLQTISSWVKRLQPNTQQIRYHCYDVINDSEYRERNDILSFTKLGKHAELVPSLKFTGSVRDMLTDSRSQGYEGLIIRPPGFGYEVGKRSKGLIKVKHFLDDEFKVIDVLESKDGWAILRCIMRNGNTFRVSSPGIMGFKRYVLDNKKQFIGKYVRVEYAGLTKVNKPSQPIAIMFRDKESE